MKETVLVTGASGFAGGHLIEQLRDTHTVVGWSRTAPASDVLQGASWAPVDLSDARAVRQALQELAPTKVYHLAGATQVDRSWTSPTEPLEANVMATHHLLDGVRRNGQSCRVLITGSATLYAADQAPLLETSPLAPMSPYAVSKLAQEMLALRAATEDGIDVVITRSFNHTGPRQTPSFVAPAIARQVALIERGDLEAVIRVGNLEARRDLSDVRDIVRAYRALMDVGVSGEIYNVAGGEGRSIQTVVDALVARSRVPVRVVVDPARVRPVDTPSIVGDSSKLRAVTGWTPQISFDQMLTDLLDYWRRAA